MNSRHIVALFAPLLLSGTLLAAQAPAPAPAPQAAPDTTQPPAPIERQAAPLPPTLPPGQRGMFRGPMPPHDLPPLHGFPGGMGGGVRIVPPGIWWRDPVVVQRLALTPEQTGKMDEIFQQSRLQLIDLKANVERQDAILEPMLSVNPVNQPRALAQIDKVAQARAELERASAKMLLGIRAVLTPEQWSRLQTLVPELAPGGPPLPVMQPGSGRRSRGPRPAAPADRLPPQP